MQITNEFKEMKEQINENLMSDLLLGYLENDDLMMYIANTKLLNRYREKLVNLDDLVLVYNFIEVKE